MRLVTGLILCCLVIAACSTANEQPAEPSTPTAPPGSEKSVVFEDDFETDPFPRWEPVRRTAWDWARADGSRVFELAKNVPLDESVRAPFNRNLVEGVVVEDFQFDVDLRSTTRDYPNQSLCLFFGYRDPEHMYYVHFGRTTSDTSNQVFIVNGQDRTPISTQTTSGTTWDEGWHHARVVRKVDEGTIDVYFDDMTEPAMTATDTTFAAGQVGIGSFDDTGQFDNVVLRDVVSRSPQR
jgi:hypothetical protein